MIIIIKNLSHKNGNLSSGENEGKSENSEQDQKRGKRRVQWEEKSGDPASQFAKAKEAINIWSFPWWTSFF